MGLRLKFNLVMIAVFVIGLGVTGYLSYELLHRNERRVSGEQAIAESQ